MKHQKRLGRFPHSSRSRQQLDSRTLEKFFKIIDGLTGHIRSGKKIVPFLSLVENGTFHGTVSIVILNIALFCSIHPLYCIKKPIFVQYRMPYWQSSVPHPCFMFHFKPFESLLPIKVVDIPLRVSIDQAMRTSFATTFFA